MFTRLLNVIRGWFGLAVSDLEKRNPEALLELEAENLRKQVGSYNQGLAAHAGLAERLHRETQAALASAEVRSYMANSSIEALGSTPAEFAAYFREERDRWAAVIKETGAKID